MRNPILVLVASIIVALGSSNLPRVHAASSHATSVSREIVKLDAMSGSKVVGTAVLVYDHKKNMTTATVTASRLQPRSVHPADIHLGRCNTFKGPIVHALATLHADRKGNATVTSTFRGPVSHDKWYVAIHLGPTLKSKSGAKFVACGDVS